MQEFSDKTVVFITGGSRGLGKTMVERFHAAGNIVVFTYREKRADIEKEIEAGNGEIIGIQADASDYRETEVAVQDAIERYGHIDVLINNAFSAKDSSLENNQPEDFEYTINNILYPVYNYTKVVASYMIKRNKGKIISIGSVNGIHGREGSIGYCTAKAGIIGFSKTVAKELGKYNITCNVVAPGYIATEGQQRTSEIIKTHVLNECYIKKLSKPGEVSNLVEFLASDKADNITGQIFQVDCGQYI